MSNNRMYLRCPHCPEAKPLMLAKYYPSTGWYAFGPNSPDDGFEVKVNEFFESHRHDSQWGNGFKLEFEIHPDAAIDPPVEYLVAPEPLFVPPSSVPAPDPKPAKPRP
jgi:hypothetical protein